MPILTIRLPAELHERFLAECEKREIKPSEFGRRAIEAFVDHWMDQCPAQPAADVSRETNQEAQLRADLLNHGTAITKGGKRVDPADVFVRATGTARVVGFATDGSPVYAKGPASRLKGDKKP